MSEKDNNVMPLATDPHNLGEFDNVYDAMRRYPNGGVDGDYIYILGVQHFWNVNRQSWGILKDKEDNLVQMVEDFIGLFERRGYVFAGYALPDTTPVSGLDNIFYIAAKNGVYTHFGSDLKLLNEVAILRKPRRSSIWIKDSMDIPNSERIDVIDDAISRINVDIETIKSAIIGMENDLDGVHDSIDDINKDIDAFKKETSENFEEVNSDLDKVEKRLDYIPKESFLSARPAGFKPDIDLTPEITVDRAWRDHEGNVIRDTYITRRGLRNEIIDITNQQVTDLKPGSVDPDDLSEATKQLIGNKSITNLPDEEDITVTDNQTLKLKDKEYAPKDYSGMGRVYLRKHYVNGVNTLTQHMMRKPNTIYIIQYDYCLAGQTIEVPENCVLDFQGGSLRNGIINCHNTIIRNQFKGSTTLIGSYILEDALPDEEDITIEDHSLKFKDRQYNTNNYIGKGYKILRKNIVNGKNVLTQEMVNEENTIYDIRYDFDLDFDWDNYEFAHNYAVKIPRGCILRYSGGSIFNGLLNFADDTYIEGPERGDCMKYGSYGYVDKPRYSVQNDPSVINRLSEIFISYYKQNENFHYGHENTLLRPDFKIDEPWYMNCSSFSTAMILGIPFENSKYNGKDNIQNGFGWYDKDFIQWVSGSDNIHFYKYSHNLARYLNDRGYTLPESQNNIENLQPGDVLFYNLENKDPFNNPFYYKGIDHSATFAFRVNDNRFAVWEVWGESQVFGLGYYDNSYFDEHIKLVARLPKAYSDNKQQANLAENPYNGITKIIEANSSYPNTLIKKVTLSKPIQAYKYYTVIAKLRFLTDRKNAFPYVRYSKRGYFSYYGMIETPKDDMYYIPFCFTNEEIQISNPPSPIEQILEISSVNLEIYWKDSPTEVKVELDECFLVEGIVSMYNSDFKRPSIYPTGLLSEEWNEIFKNIGSEWTKVPEGWLICGRFELKDENDIIKDFITMNTLKPLNDLKFNNIIFGNTMNSEGGVGVIFLDFRTTPSSPTLKVRNKNGGVLHYFSIIIPTNVIKEYN